jgi:two-component system, sensor histidine kinase and response regulator
MFALMATGSTEDQRLMHLEVVSGILAHDLKNPLAAVIMNARMLRSSESERSRAIGARIVTSGERMARMIDQILEWARTRASETPFVPTRVDCNLGRIVDEVVAELRARKPDVPITVEARGDLRGRWDADRLAQVVSNVVGNALDHAARPGASISLVGQERGDDEDVTLTVTNEGRIDDALLPVIFEPFGGRADRTDRSTRRGRGIGLGLFITREILRAHGGRIDVASAGPTTVSFVVRLPRDG